MAIEVTSYLAPVPSSLRVSVSTWTWSFVMKSLQSAAVATTFGPIDVPPQNCAAKLSFSLFVRLYITRFSQDTSPAKDSNADNFFSPPFRGSPTSSAARSSGRRANVRRTR